MQPGTAFTDSATELTKIQELMYELRVGEIMTRPVITVTPDAAMRRAKDLMRSHRISGLPVVEADELRGIVSVEDVIRWLELSPIEATVAQWMTPRVLTVRSNEPAVQAINKFRTYHVGRLPVLDQEGRLAGIVTPGDIIDRVLRVLDALYREAEPRQHHERPAIEDLVSEHTTVTLRYTVAPNDFEGTGLAATRIKRLLEGLRVEPQIVRRAGIAVYEAEMNLTIHAINGGRVVARVEPDLLEIEASDDGPGNRRPAPGDDSRVLDRAGLDPRVGIRRGYGPEQHRELRRSVLYPVRTRERNDCTHRFRFAGQEGSNAPRLSARDL